MNGNSNGLTNLKRMELTFKDKSYAFTINPENYDIKLQSRLNLIYTKGGAFIDQFGEGVKEINVSGTTGFRATTDNKEHGYEKFLELKALVEENFNNIKQGEEIVDFLNFYNHTDGEAYVTVPIRLGIMRSVNQPLLYKYELSLYAIRRVGDPAPSNEIKQAVGNAEGPVETAPETVANRTLMESNVGTDNSFSESNKELTKKTKVKYFNIDSEGNLKLPGRR